MIPSPIEELVKTKGFIKSIRRQSLTLTSEKNVEDDEIIEIAINESFPRILLRLATIKDKDDNPVFKGPGPNRDYREIYKEVSRLVVEPPFSAGLVRIAGALTASTLIKSIPLNGDIKLLDLAKEIESNAIKDLESIVGLIESSEFISVSLIDEDSRFLKESDKPISFSFSHTIDKNSIPSLELFDLVELGNTGRFDSFPLKTYNQIQLDPDYISFCWIFLSSGDKGSKERAFLLPNEFTSTELAELIGSYLNETLLDVGSNLMASVNKGRIKTHEIKLAKSDITQIDDNSRDPEIVFDVRAAIDEIQIVSRESSSSINREVVSLGFYSVSRDLISNINNLSSSALINLKSKAKRYVDQLLFGIYPYYHLLSKESPKSLIIDIEKGSLQLINQREEEIDLQRKRTDLLNHIDTFFFDLDDGYQFIQSGNMKVRVSTASTEDDLNEWIINIPEGSTPKDVAFMLTDSLYPRQDNNDVVGSMSYGASVQIIPFVMTDPEVRITVDILSLPLGLSIATGTKLEPITPFRAEHRSITVKTQVNFLNQGKASGGDVHDGPPGIGVSAERGISPALEKGRQRIKRASCSTNNLQHNRNDNFFLI